MFIVDQLKKVSALNYLGELGDACLFILFPGSCFCIQALDDRCYLFLLSVLAVDVWLVQVVIVVVFVRVWMVTCIGDVWLISWLCGRGFRLYFVVDAWFIFVVSVWHCYWFCCYLFENKVVLPQEREQFGKDAHMHSFRRTGLRVSHFCFVQTARYGAQYPANECHCLSLNKLTSGCGNSLSRTVYVYSVTKAPSLRTYISVYVYSFAVPKRTILGSSVKV